MCRRTWISGWKPWLAERWQPKNGDAILLLRNEEPQYWTKAFHVFALYIVQGKYNSKMAQRWQRKGSQSMILQEYILWQYMYSFCLRKCALHYARYTHKTSGFKTSGFKRLVSKCLVSKRQVYKTSGLQNVRFQNVWFQNVEFKIFINLLNKKYRNCQVCIPI